MGCRKSKTLYGQSTTENARLVNYEDRLQIHSHTIHEYEAIIRRFNPSIISPSRALEIIQEELKLKTLPARLIEVLQEKLTLNGQTDIKSLLTFAILYGSGSDREKANALWHAADTGYDVKLGKTEIQGLIKTIIKVSIAITLDAAIKDDHFNTNRLNTWRDQLNDRSESLEERLVAYFLMDKDSIDKGDFISALLEGEESRITAAIYVRTLLEHTKVVPKKFANPFKNMKTKLTSDN